MPTGNTQQIIDYGASANDGTGDPLRTAFIKTDENFDNIWLAGPVGSNVRINNNTISVLDTNGNLILSPNGVGVIQTNNHLVPRANRTYDIGSANLQYRTVYANTATFQTLSIGGDFSVSGNLTVSGNIIEMGNIVTDALTLQLANTAANAASANGAGITVGANDNIATFLYNSTSNSWVTNLAVTYSNGNPVGGNPGGSNTQVQFNDGGSFGGQSGFVFDKTSGNLSIPGKILTISSLSANANVANNSGITVQGANASIIYNSFDQGWSINKHVKIRPDNGSNIWYFGNTTTNDSLVFPSGASWKSDAANREEYLNSVANGYINMQTYNAAGNLASQFHMEHGLVHLNVFDGVQQQWEFNMDGTTHFPGMLVPHYAANSISDIGNAAYPWGNIVVNGNIVGVTPNNAGSLQWVGNSSGDGYGFTTMQLVPDNTLGSDQRIIVDPTGPNHIHLRAGGPQDDSSAQLYLGGELSHFKVDNGLNPNVYVAANSYKWTFGSDGNLTLPGDNVSTAFSRITSLANSSGDGAGYTTLGLIPDINLTGNDQYLIVDPTAPGHIHIRAGGTQDNSNADLFLGGENSYFKVAAGANSDVVVRSNGNNWTFDTNGTLTLPGEGILRSIGDTVTLQSLNISSGNANGVYLGTAGGLGFFDQDIGGNWLEIFRSGTEPEIRVPVGRGNLNIQTAEGITAYNWLFDNTGNLTLPTQGNIVGATPNNAGHLQWVGNSSGDGAGYTTLQIVPDDTAIGNDQYLIIDPTAPGHIHIRAGGTQDNSNADLFLGGENSYFRIAAGANAQAQITSNSNTWVFNTDGNLQVPGNINGDNSAPLVIDGASSGEGFIRLPSASFGGEQVAIVNQFSLGNGIALTTNGGTWHFDNTGNLTTPGTISASSTISGQVLVSTQSAANEGGEIQLALPSSGSTLGGNVIIDSYQNWIRLFEGGGNSRGLYVDVPNVSVSGQYAIGYRDVPQIPLSGNVTANSITAGKHFYSTTAGNLQITIPDNANVAFPTGATITVVVNAAGNVILAQGTGVSLYMAGSSTTGNRTVGAYGLASVMKVATNTWVISGTGVY